MLGAGVPVVQSLEIAGQGHANVKMRELVATLKNEVESGTALSDTLRKHPIYFNDLICNLVDAGEQSGSLDTMLDRIATYKEKPNL